MPPVPTAHPVCIPLPPPCAHLTELECSDGFEDITIDGTVVPSRFDYFASGVSSLTAYDLAGLGLIREGAQVCVHISSCCRYVAWLLQAWCGMQD